MFFALFGHHSYCNFHIQFFLIHFLVSCTDFLFFFSNTKIDTITLKSKNLVKHESNKNNFLYECTDKIYYKVGGPRWLPSHAPSPCQGIAYVVNFCFLLQPYSHFCFLFSKVCFPCSYIFTLLLTVLTSFLLCFRSFILFLW